MNYCAIKDCDVADGPGVRVTLFVSGCTNHCEGCFQPQTWDFDYGEPYTPDTQTHLLSLLGRPYIRGLTLLGGEPMEPANQPSVLSLMRAVRESLPGKDIWLYSGFTFEALTCPGSRCHTGVTGEILSLADVLVDGPFILAKKDLMLRFRGSSNQRLLDMPQTLLAGAPVAWNG